MVVSLNEQNIVEIESNDQLLFLTKKKVYLENLEAGE